MSICRCFCGVIFVFTLCLSITAQQSANQAKANICRQDKKSKLQMIEAAENKYRISRIEILGHTFLYDRDIRRRIALNEGDVFTRNSLDETIVNLNKWELLKLTTIKNTKISLDTENKDVYMILCVEEKKK